MSENKYSMLTNLQWSPKTLVTGAVTTLFGALLAASLSWVHNVNGTQNKHEAIIAVLDERSRNTEKAVDEIKSSQLRVEDKLDRILVEKKEPPKIYGR